MSPEPAHRTEVEMAHRLVKSPGGWAGALCGGEADTTRVNSGATAGYEKTSLHSHPQGGPSCPRP